MRYRVRMADPGEVFEIVDRLSGRRVTETVYLTASDALDRLAKWPEKYHKGYRVQSVVVWARQLGDETYEFPTHRLNEFVPRVNG